MLDAVVTELGKLWVAIDRRSFARDCFDCRLDNTRLFRRQLQLTK